MRRNRRQGALKGSARGNFGKVGVGGSKKRESKSQLSGGFGVAVELAVFAGPKREGTALARNTKRWRKDW